MATHARTVWLPTLLTIFCRMAKNAVRPQRQTAAPCGALRNALAGADAIAISQGERHSVDETVGELTASSPNTGRRWKAAAAAGLVGLLGVVGAAKADIVNPGDTSNSDMYAAWEYNQAGDNLTGDGMIYLENIGSESRYQFEWNVADLLTLTAPGGWDFTYNPDTDVVKLEGLSTELGAGQNITIPFTFDASNKELRAGALDYFGSETSGTLDNVAEVYAIPEPASVTIMVLGAVALLRGRKRL